MCFAYKYVASPVGRLKLVASEAGLAAVLWENSDPTRVPLPQMQEDGRHGLLAETERQLRDYIAGERTTFKLPLDLRGTPFQQEVWRALQAIPFGATLIYGELAHRLGKPGASRAVGAANGRNPISIIVPCHRVVGSTGKLTGFAGGMDAKEYLLRLERPSGSTLFA